jgi:hypothetical protein
MWCPRGLGGLFGWAPPPPPPPRSHLTHRLRQPPSVSRLSWGNVPYRVESGGTIPNRPGWDAQMLDVVARHPAPARISMAPHQHRAPIAPPDPLPAGGCALKDITEAKPVRERAQRVQPDMRHDLVATASRLHSDRAVTVQVASALLARGSVASRTSESLARRVSIRDCSPSSGLSPVKDQG